MTSEHDPEQAREIQHTDFLTGGGELGDRIRHHEWSATPLGPLDAWPQPLRVAVSLCLKSQFPIIIHWGWPDLIVLYNNAFIPLIGDKHPAALGTRLFDSWPELRPTIEGMLETVLTEGKGALSEGLLHVYNRSGFLEERYYTVSFNPIVLESGKPGGSFTLIDNITDRVIGERRLRTLRDLAASSGDVKETEEACRIAAAVLYENRYDFPFALLYVLEKDRKVARLVSVVGLESGSSASPSTIRLSDSKTDAAWPLVRVAAMNEAVQVDDLEQRFGPLPGGPWDDSPKSALVLPITPTGRRTPEAMLVAGISPRRGLDTAYRNFLESIRNQIAASIMRVMSYQSHKMMEDQLRAIVHTIPALAWTANPGGDNDFFNQRWLDYAGVTSEEVQDWGWQGVIHPDDLDRLVGYWRSKLASGETGEIEARIRRHDGEYRWFLFRAHPLRDESGNIIKWYGTNVDIEDRKRAEQLHAELDRAKQLRQIVDAIPQMIVVLNPDGTRIYANQTSLDYTGLTIPEVISGDFRERAIHPEDVARLRTERGEALSRGQPFENEQRLLGKDGHYRWFLMQYKPVIDEDGRPIRWYVTATDIEHRKQTEERIRNENLALREQINRDSMFEDIVGSSEPLRKVLTQLTKVAPSDSTVLVLGETGTGKELIARAIHKRSKRTAQAFIGVNCGAIPASLIASELFGHEKGAFTGATQRRLGRFEAANGGTIFLDEVGDLPQDIQIALLRVLQEREIERVGSDKPIPVDVRVVAATHRDLETLVSEGKFRQDLLYRINVVPIHLPSLRERAADIPLLVEYFIARFGKKTGKKFRTIDQRTLKLLQAYEWPGNVRELQNVIERAVILSESDNFVVDEMWLKREPSQVPRPTAALSCVLLRQEKEMIEAALADCRGQVAGPAGAARKLGLPTRTLDSKIKRLGIDKYRFKSQAG